MILYNPQFDDDDDCEGVSNEAMELTMKLLNKNPNERITAEEALNDDWFGVRSENNLKKALKNFKKKEVEEEVEEEDEEEEYSF